MNSGTGSGRGRHKGYRSPERRRWDEIAATVDGWKPEPKQKQAKPKPAPPPARPPWMDDGEYQALCDLREKL